MNTTTTTATLEKPAGLTQPRGAIAAAIARCTAPTGVEHLATTLATARHLGLGLSAMQTLLLLSSQEDLHMSHLALELGISTAAMTSVAKSLIAKRLIERSHSSGPDMRHVTLRLTELGRSRVFQLTGTHLS